MDKLTPENIALFSLIVNIIYYIVFILFIILILRVVLVRIPSIVRTQRAQTELLSEIAKAQGINPEVIENIKRKAGRTK
jgi:Na+/phosphate symporter